MHYALSAGELFDLSQKDEFVETIIGMLSSFVICNLAFLDPGA